MEYRKGTGWLREPSSKQLGWVQERRTAVKFKIDKSKWDARDVCMKDVAAGDVAIGVLGFRTFSV